MKKEMRVTNEMRDVTDEMITAAARLAALDFTAAERGLMVEGLQRFLRHYEALRGVPLDNSVFPALRFVPQSPPASQEDKEPAAGPPSPRAEPFPTRPADPVELAFAPVSRQAALLRARKISSVELTELYLERLRTYDPLLHCVVTLTAERALEQARRADEERAAGLDRGPLHGIPWGAKDLLATRGYPTTWGAGPFQEQQFDYDATVVERLEQAGAVLLAKLTLGELAWGDVWFGGKTRSPWNPAEGSSGSSAGSAAATAAALVGFSIGSETWGSIVSPSQACGTTGLRPTFGRVSRHGAMALSWSMDKIGPICRTVEDCALVFAAIQGPDGLDPTVVEQPFHWQPRETLRGLRIGYVEADFELDYSGSAQDQQSLDLLRALGAELVPVSLPAYPVEALSFILTVEAAAAFDELTRSGQDEQLVRQGKETWPNEFRQARLVPAVEYIQANRVRTLLMQEMARLLQDIDLYVAPSVAGNNLLLTNLTGHPAVVLPNGFTAEGMPTTITFTGRLYDEETLLAVAHLCQQATDFHGRVPAGLL